jgi:hypothetical protein
MLRKKKMSEQTEFEQDLKTLLVTVHNAVDWKKVSQRSYKWDVFTHAVQAAANQESVPKFLDRICENLSIQSIQAPADLLLRLRSNQRLILNALRKETQFWVALVAYEVNS